MKRKYTAFTKAFKQQTLDVASQPNTCIARLTRDLGIRRFFSFWTPELL
jgi:transposase